jgi:hypothetical protein
LTTEYFVAKIDYTCDQIPIIPLQSFQIPRIQLKYPQYPKTSPTINDIVFSVYTLKKIKNFQSIPLKSIESRNQLYLPFKWVTRVKNQLIGLLFFQRIKLVGLKSIVRIPYLPLVKLVFLISNALFYWNKKKYTSYNLVDSKQKCLFIPSSIFPHQ